MGEQIINQNAIEDPIIRKLFEEGDFEQLLQYCSEKKDLSSLLYKAIALVELGKYEEGKLAYIEYIDSNDVFEQITDHSIATLKSLFASVAEKSLNNVQSYLDEALQDPAIYREARALSEFTNMFGTAKAIVEAANKRSGNNSYDSVMVYICAITPRFAEAFLSFTQSLAMIVIESDEKQNQTIQSIAANQSNPQNGDAFVEMMAAMQRRAKSINRLHMMYPACVETINLSMGYNAHLEHIDTLADQSQRLVRIIHSVLAKNTPVRNVKTGAISYAQLLPYDSNMRTNSINYLGDAITLAKKIDPEFIAPTIPPLSNPSPKPTQTASTTQQTSSSGCYVATAVYGSYDCPQVWTLRRYRDNTLAETWYGRAFIRTYYAISPTIVKWFGHTEWFKNLWKTRLDALVQRLQREGIADTPYSDKTW